MVATQGSVTSMLVTTVVDGLISRGEIQAVAGDVDDGNTGERDTKDIVEMKSKTQVRLHAR